jgi:ubiquinone/menaquinone biosynthesis C-methylase UbiE
MIICNTLRALLVLNLLMHRGESLLQKATNHDAMPPITSSQTQLEPLSSKKIKKQTPRVLNTLDPLRLTNLEKEYITAAIANMNRYKSYYTAVALAVDKFDSSPLPQKLTNVATSLQSVPRILQHMHKHPFQQRTNNIRDTVVQTTSVHPKTRKVLPNVEAISKLFDERAAYLMLEDLNNIREGIYPFPSDLKAVREPAKLVLEVIQQFQSGFQFAFRDKTYSGQVEYATKRQEPSAYLQELSKDLDLPEYYLTDFHSVPGGFLAEEHPPMYDLLSETVFHGTGLMSRRMMLPPISMAMKKLSGNASGKGFCLLDLGCGNGSFFVQLLEAFPSLTAEGIDLSPAMLEYARKSTMGHKTLQGASSLTPPKLTRANMEVVPREAASFDFVTQSNCFHEMPENAIRNTVSEIARVLKPGGVAVLHDAVQFCDDASMAATSKVLFDAKFNEPYIQDYMTNVNLDIIFAAQGMQPLVSAKPYCQSVVRCYKKPQASNSKTCSRIPSDL